MTLGPVKRERCLQKHNRKSKSKQKDTGYDIPKSSKPDNPMKKASY